jgi:glycerol uptake facilitator-like aquaporin
MSINQIITHCTMEFIACMFLTFGLIRLDVDTNTNLLLFVFISIAATCSVYRVTGGQLNPALTIVNMLRRDKPEGFSYVLSILYIISQYMGCFIGAFFHWWFTRGTGSMNLGKNPRYMSEALYSEAIGMETFGGFILGLAYLGASGKETATSIDSGIQGIFIGATYAGLVSWSILVTGGCLNPAYAWGQNLIHWIDTESEYSIQYLWLYTAFPIIGAIFAWAFHWLIMLKGSKDYARKSDVEDAKADNRT